MKCHQRRKGAVFIVKQAGREQLLNVYSAGRGAETRGVTETEAAREINSRGQSSAETQTIKGTKGKSAED